MHQLWKRSIVYCATRQHCHMFAVEGKNVVRCTFLQLARVYEEIDSWIILYIEDITEAAQEPAEVILSCGDTDVSILLLHLALNLNAYMWRDAAYRVCESMTHYQHHWSCSLLWTSHMPCTAWHMLCSAWHMLWTAWLSLCIGKLRPLDLVIKHDKFTSEFATPGQPQFMRMFLNHSRTCTVRTMHAEAQTRDVSEGHFT